MKDIKNIQLKFEDKDFFELREHKAKLSHDLHKNLTWEQYIEELFNREVKR